MFIAVVPYKSKTTMILDKILVLDTSDYTLEYASYTECEILELGVVGIELSDSGEYFYSDFDNLRRNISSHLWKSTDSSRYKGYIILLPNFPDIDVRVPNEPAKTSDGRVASFYINGKMVFTRNPVRAVELLYVFKFSSYIVLRFVVFGFRYEYYTMILDKHGEVVSRYFEDIDTVVGDKGLAYKVDLISKF